MLKVKAQARAIADRVMDMAADSTLTSGAIALALIGTACYMWASGLEVPERLYALLYSVIGFFFLSKKVKNGRVG